MLMEITWGLLVNWRFFLEVGWGFIGGFMRVHWRFFGSSSESHGRFIGGSLEVLWWFDEVLFWC